MSHFSKIRTQMVDKTFLIEALKDLSLNFEEGDLTIRGFGGTKTKVEIMVHVKGLSNDIGLKKNGDQYEIIADWWGVRGTTSKQFSEQLARRYAYHATRSKLEEQGFTLVEEKEENSGQIHLVLRRMV